MTGEVADVLDRAADLLERDGWGHLWIDTHGRRCIAGAIAGGVREANAYGTGAYDAAKRAACSLAGIRNLPEWNDAPERTAEEVIATLRRAADSERGKQ